MPTYRNPNTHPITVTITDPRTTLVVYPSSWDASRIPLNGVQRVELDPRLAAPLLRCRMLALVSSEPPLAAPETPAADLPVAPPSPEAPTSAVEPLPKKVHKGVEAMRKAREAKKAAAAAKSAAEPTNGDDPLPPPAKVDDVPQQPEKPDAPPAPAKRKFFYISE